MVCKLYNCAKWRTAIKENTKTITVTDAARAQSSLDVKQYYVNVEKIK